MNCPWCNADDLNRSDPVCDHCGKPLPQPPYAPNSASAAPESYPNGDLFFKNVVESYVNHDRFVRRDWLAEDAIERLCDPNCRFLLMTAEPGSGKSTFVAQLADDHPNWPVYFIRRDQRTPLGDASAHSFLLHLGYQLSALYPDLFTRKSLEVTVKQRIGTIENEGEVVGAEVQRIVASPFYRRVVEIQQQVARNSGKVTGIKIGEWVIDPSLLPLNDLQNMALLEPARALLQNSPETLLIVLVDALDELRYHRVEDTLLTWLTNCPALPANVRFLLTSRPPDDALQVFCAKQQPFLRTLSIESGDKRVKNDLQAYLKKITAIEEVATTLSTPERTEEFLTKALEKADGNIGYLDAVARAIDQATRLKSNQAIASILKLDELPGHLEGLYALFLKVIKASVDKQSVEIIDSTGSRHYVPAWSAVYRRILSVLSVTLEPLTLNQIQQLGDIQAEWGYFTESVGRLSQFLEQRAGRFRLYHATVPEFLTSKRTQDNPEISDLFVDRVRWHGEIASYFWKTYKNDWQQCDAYGLNNLATHLQRSDSTERLKSLISEPWMRARFRGSGFTYGGFLSDVSLAWQSVLKEGANITTWVDLTKLQTARHVVGEQIQYYGETDLQTLAWLGRENEALAHARLHNDTHQRFKRLLAVYQALKAKGQPQFALLDEAREMARMIDYEADRSAALYEVGVEFVAVQRFDEALALARTSESEETRAALFVSIAVGMAKVDHLSARAVFDEARTLLSTMENASGDMYLRQMAIELAAIGRYTEVIEICESESEPFNRDFLLESVPVAVLRAGLYVEAWELITKNDWTPETKTSLLAEFFKISAQAGGQSNMVFNEAQRMTASLIASGSISPVYKLDLAVGLAQAGCIPEAQQLTLTMDDPLSRAKARRAVAKSLALTNARSADAAIEEAWAAAGRIDSESQQEQELQELICDVIEAGKFEKAHELIKKMSEGYYRDVAQEKLVMALGRVGRGVEARELALSLTGESQPEFALRGLALVLAEAGDRELSNAVLDEALMLDRSRNSNVLRALEEITKGFAACHRFDEALRVSREIKESDRRARSLIAVLTAMAQVGDAHIGSVLEETKEVISEGQRSSYMPTFKDLATALAKAGRIDLAHQVDPNFSLNGPIRDLVDQGRFDEARESVKALESFRQPEALTEIALALFRTGDYQQAHDIALSLENPEHRFEALNRLAATMSEYGHALAGAVFVEAREVANSLEGEVSPSIALGKLAESLINVQQYEEARAVADTITYKIERVRALCSLGTALFKTGDGRTLEVFAEAREAANAISNNWQKGAGQSHVAIALANANFIDLARELTRSIFHDVHRHEGEKHIALAMARAGSFDEARELGRTIGNHVLREVASLEAEAGQIADALTTAPASNIDEFITQLANWVPQLEQIEPELSVAMISSAMDVAAWVRPDWARARMVLKAHQQAAAESI